MAMIYRDVNFSNEGYGTSAPSKVAAIGKALPWLIEKWWPHKYSWQGICISHMNTRGRATSSHKHVCGNDILLGIIAYVAN